ncbi:MAG: sulfite exporter TauE/SafE family protein [Pseudonocardia sp.]|nr:sulfite exporter TauE/SafE family protein [Pseudonocardia sp.]
MTAGTFALLVVAGIAAGLSGSIAGLASLFSYPALLATGLPATTANVTNTVALLANSVGSVAGSGPELAGQGRHVKRLLPISLVGGAAGAGLLLITPAGGFERIVPFLVGGASIVLLLQPRIRTAAAETSGPTTAPVVIGMLAVAVYGGYFGAASGVLQLALLLVALPVSLLQANGLKNVLSGGANAVAAVGFALFGPVAWSAVLPLALGLLVGGRLGPVLARRLPTGVLRVGIALAGIGLAVKLGLDAF